MHTSGATPTADRVLAAQRGDRAALGALIEDHLTMLYNVAGRALNGHADVDDVVQETLLRAVENLPFVREPARFSGWLLAIAHRQIAERIRRRLAAADRSRPLDAAPEAADPAADFADLTVLRLGLSGQRRQVVEAVRWLDPDDRLVLSLWWLEVAGTITRADLAAALGIPAGHAAVRVKRMLDQLELARHIVTVLAGGPGCPGLSDVLAAWPGRPEPVWRKRLGRHLRGCRSCSGSRDRLVPPQGLLAGLAMLPVPPSLGAVAGLGTTTTGLAAATTGAATGAAATAAGTTGAATGAAATAAGTTSAAAAAGTTSAAAAAGSGWLGASAFTKAVVATVGAVAVSGGVAVAVHDSPKARQPPPIAATTTPPPTTPTATTPTPSPSARTTTTPIAYGEVVDKADAPPPKNRKPRPLPPRPAGTLTVTGADFDPRPEVTSLIHRGESATYRGRGYLRVEFAIAFTQRTGGVAMPSWTGLRGKLFHVASGGGRRLDDPAPGGPAEATGMGDPEHGYATLPQGTQQMWAFEYYYLDGEVTYTSNERGADYNLYVHIVTRADIDADIRTPPNATGGPIRYGLTRDDGTNACPVPQYATRATPEDPATVPRRSRLR